MSDPAALARAYVERVNARDADALVALFAEDGVLRHPVGVFEGRPAMKDFYRDLVFAGKALVQLQRMAVDGDVAFFELTATSELDPDFGVVETVDVLESENGLISRLSVYAR